MEYDYATSQTPAKGIQVGLEPTPTPNAALAATQASIPGFGGNIIEVDIVTNKNKSAVYTSKAYPANADGKQRPGAVAEYNSEFSVGEGIGGYTNILPSGYLRAAFLESSGSQYIDTGYYTRDFYEATVSIKLGLVKESKFAYIGAYHSGGYSLQCWIDGAKPSAGGVFFSSTALNVSIFNFEKFYAIQLNKNFIKVDGEEYSAGAITKKEEVEKTNDKFLLFGRSEYGSTAARPYACKISSFSVHAASGSVIDVIAAIDNSGTPCLYDKAKKKTFRNSGTGAFIVGLTLAQARKLGNLPAGGGTLKVSLPSNYGEDEGVVNAISKANSKGWNIEVTSTWDASGVSTTFGMRRIWVRKTQDENGNYVAVDGTRWAVESCVAMYNVDGSEPEAHGYEPYRSIEAAVSYWELEPYVYPEEEEFSQDIKYN